MPRFAALPKVYHVAKKAIPYAHPDTGATITKSELAPLGNTGIKLESFIFDVFPAAKNMGLLEVERAEEFSPVKNAPGSKEDSPDTARALLAALHRGWLAAAGVQVPEGTRVEVSPLVSFAGEGVAEAVAAAGLVEVPAGTPAVLLVAAGEATDKAEPGTLVVRC